MTDDLDKLKTALERATPAPDAEAKAKALAAARVAFEEKFQGSEAGARPTKDQPQGAAGFLKGLSEMFAKLTTRQGLLATTSVATIALAVVLTQDLSWQQPEQEAPETAEETSQLKAAAADENAPEAPGLHEDAASVQYPTLVAPEGGEADGFYRRTEADAGAGTDTGLDGRTQSATTELAQEVMGDNEAARVDENRPAQELAGIMDSQEEVVIVEEEPADFADAAPQSEIEPRRAPEPRPTPSSEAVPSIAAAPSEMNTEAARSAGGGVTTTGEARLGLLYEDSADEAASTSRNRVIIQNGVPGGDSGLTSGDDLVSPPPPEQNTERFAEAAPNPIKAVSDEPVSTFSIDVDTASYSYIRSALMGGQLPPPASVRIEEMVNYFDYDYPAPDRIDTPFQTSVSVIDTPWNEGTKLMHIGIQGYEIPVENRPPVNLVFLIDTSGSMQDANKLPLLIQSFRLLLGTLQDDDSVAIVTYAGSAGMALEPTPASETSKILAALENLHAGGSTAGQDGLQQAYALAEDMSAEGEISRVILATDGDFNVGISDPEALKRFIEDKRDSGTYLSVLGFGRGNYQDATMQALAQNGNGTAAYIDTLAEAQKVLVEQVGGALFPIANDVKIQVEFNPAMIAEYRLLGYETRALAREDFNNDAVDAGEIGAGHTVTAIYEITPVGSPAVSVDPLRYAAEENEPLPVTEPHGEIGYLKLRYKRPGEEVSTLIETPVFMDRADIAASETQFAAAVAGFGELLRGSKQVHGFDFDDVAALAAASRGEDPFGYRAEFQRLVQLAKTAR